MLNIAHFWKHIFIYFHVNYARGVRHRLLCVVFFTWLLVKISDITTSIIMSLEGFDL